MIILVIKASYSTCIAATLYMISAFLAGSWITSEAENGNGGIAELS